MSAIHNQVTTEYEQSEVGDSKHWKQRVVMMPTLPSQVMTTYGATSDDKVDINTTFDFQNAAWVFLGFHWGYR